MSDLIVPRRLWHETEDGFVSMEQSDLLGSTTPIVILGEAGMGKTELLHGWLAQQLGYAYCTARQLTNRHNPRSLIGDKQILIIDALDELSVRGEGDAVDHVLRKLGELNFPRFVLSCRVADWRNATGIGAIREQYDNVDPLILHLERLSDKEIVQILAAYLGGSVGHATSVVEHFSKRNLDGLLGNPQTLQLIARVARAGHLPETKAALFSRAVDLLRREHRDEKVDLQPDEETALDAAGAAFAGLILTGAEAVVVEKADPGPDDVSFKEITALPGALKLDAVLGSRLFAGSANRFTYWHRRIGEFLGSRWLAKQAGTAMKQERLLALFRSHEIVPASLRGLHAWLAYHSPKLRQQIIESDPMGVIEYGDADELQPADARLLLKALQDLATRNPRFREWQTYSIKGLVQPALLSDVRSLIIDSRTESSLRWLLIEGVKGSPIAESLRDDMRTLLLNQGGEQLHRGIAGDVLVSLGGENWLAIVTELRDMGGESVSLALEIVVQVGAEPFDEALIVSLIIAQAVREERTIGLFHRLKRDDILDKKLGSILDELVVQAARLGNRHERVGNTELTDFAYHLIARSLLKWEVEAKDLWKWLKPFEADVGYEREDRKAVHDFIRQNEGLRRGVQRLVLLEEPGDKSIWERAWRLSRRSSGLTPTPDDILELFAALDTAGTTDDKVRDLVQLTRHSDIEGNEIREVAKRFFANRSDMLSWIDKLAHPDVPEWKRKQDNLDRRRATKREKQWQEHRDSFSKNAEAMRRGEYGWVISPAKAYLGLFNDMNNHLSAHERVADWLGEELACVAYRGFEKFLESNAPPTATQIADSYAHSRRWEAGDIILAALFERARLGKGFDDVRDDRMIAGLYELQISWLSDRSNRDDLRSIVEEEVRSRGLWEFAMRGWLEPKLAQSCEHVEGLFKLMHDPADVDLSTVLASEWLERFPEIAAAPEEELIDHMIAARRHDQLRKLSIARLTMTLVEKRRRIWNSVAFLTDFVAQRERLEQVATDDPAWIWTLRDRIAGERGRSVSIAIDIEQLKWLVTTFRSRFPRTSHPSGVSSGNTNLWDASDFIAGAISRLGAMTSEAAIFAMQTLREATQDSYSTLLQIVSAEQQRKRAEETYLPIDIGNLRAIMGGEPPRTVADLQATVLLLLSQIQKRIVADPADPWVGFFRDREKGDERWNPYDEERCRDHLLTMLGVYPEEIQFVPEGHLADDNRADMIASLKEMRLPIEVKGQWHADVWRAADTQLDRLYTTDYAAERRGIYLVLWFGCDVPPNRKPKGSFRGRPAPKAASELLAELAIGSLAAREGRVAIVVLDIERPPKFTEMASALHPRSHRDQL